MEYVEAPLRVFQKDSSYVLLSDDIIWFCDILRFVMLRVILKGDATYPFHVIIGTLLHCIAGRISSRCTS